MKLHFFPGQHLLVLTKQNKVIGRYEAVGGPSEVGQDQRMPEEPTWPGSYLIHSTQRYITPTWQMSSLAWGTELQDKPSTNDVWYKLPSGKWGSMSKDFKISRDIVIFYNKRLYGKNSVPSQWIFNDFGPLAIRWFKDINGNGKLDSSERLSGQMFHTTPDNEAEYSLGKEVKLYPSHGCIHMKPSDRDTILSRGGFKQGTQFIVHKYSERFNQERFENSGL